jgi:hypothetical protein
VGRVSEIAAEILIRSESGESVVDIAHALDIPMDWVVSAITSAAIDESSFQEDGLDAWWDSSRDQKFQRCQCWTRSGGYTIDNGWSPVNVPYPHAPVCDQCRDDD